MHRPERQHRPRPRGVSRRPPHPARRPGRGLVGRTPRAGRARSGPAPETTAATPARRAAGPPAPALRHRRRPGTAGAAGPRWPRAAAPGRAVSACDEQRGAAGVERGVGVRHGLRAAARGRVRRTASASGHEHHRHGSRGIDVEPHGARRRAGRRPGEGQRRRAGTPRRCPGAPRSRWPAAARRRRSMPVDVRAERPGGQQPGDDGGGRGAEAAAVRDAVARDHAQARAAAAQLGEGGAHGAHDQVRLVGRAARRALAGDLDVQPATAVTATSTS